MGAMSKQESDKGALAELLDNLSSAEREALIGECEEALEKLLQKQLDGDESFADYEKSLLKIAHEIVRRKLEKKLQTIADSLEDRLIIDHNNDWHGLRQGTAFVYRRHAPGTVTYHSLVGPLAVQRHTYRECHRNGATSVPLELSAGLMEKMTPALAESVAIGYAFMPSRQCEEFMLASGLRPPSRSTLDRAARDLGAYAMAANEEIEPSVRANEIVDRRTCSIVVGLDRTAVPMRHGESRCGPQHGERGLRQSRPKQAFPPPNGPVEWRMDYVGTVSLMGSDGPLVTRKYRSPADAAPSAITQRMMADLHHALGQRPVDVAVVQDGAPELWRAMREALEGEPLASTWTEVLDWYHLDERLSKCLDLLGLKGRTRDLQRKRWHAQLLERDMGIRRVIRSIQRNAKSCESSTQNELATHIKYFRRNEARTRYATYRSQSTTIGSGITEGACKSVISTRAKRSGQRWSQRGLTAALHLRSIHQSDRFQSFWSFFSRRYRATCIAPLGHWS